MSCWISLKLSANVAKSKTCDFWASVSFFTRTGLTGLMGDCSPRPAWKILGSFATSTNLLLKHINMKLLLESSWLKYLRRCEPLKNRFGSMFIISINWYWFIIAENTWNLRHYQLLCWKTDNFLKKSFFLENNLCAITKNINESLLYKFAHLDLII